MHVSSQKVHYQLFIQFIHQKANAVFIISTNARSSTNLSISTDQLSIYLPSRQKNVKGVNTEYKNFIFHTQATRLTRHNIYIACKI